VKKLILVVLFALLAAACAGSDSTTNTADSSDPTSAEESDPGTETDSEPESDAGSGAGDEAAADDSTRENVEVEAEEPDLPDRVNSVPIQARDCAHSSGELSGGDDAVEIELPPDVKPEVDAEFLGEIDELIVTDLIEGTGDAAVSGSSVEMQYVGVLGADGTEFDSSWDPQDQPFGFVLDSGQVIAGWDEGIQGMKVGGRRVLQIPSDQAYGDQARSEIIVADSDLVFIVDLLAVSPPPEPSPPIDDSYLASFDTLEITDLVEGDGCEALSGDIVVVNYVGVDTDGTEFDSSWTRNALFQLTVGKGQVIEGWREGIEGMKVGGERILQIPSGLAYDDGDLIFRVHLEELIEAPLAHTIDFEGSPPDELEVTTLVEGDAEGEEVAPGSIVDAHIVVALYKSNTIAQSSYQDGSTVQLAIQEGSLLPGLEEGLIGAQVGEIRQIVLPADVAYPDGIPEDGIDDDDAFVFFVEPLRILN